MEYLLLWGWGCRSQDSEHFIHMRILSTINYPLQHSNGLREQPDLRSESTWCPAKPRNQESRALNLKLNTPHPISPTCILHSHILPPRPELLKRTLSHKAQTHHGIGPQSHANIARPVLPNQRYMEACIGKPRIT